MIKAFYFHLKGTLEIILLRSQKFEETFQMEKEDFYLE